MEFRTTYNYATRVRSGISHCLQLHNNQPLVDMGEPRASQCLAHLEYIQVGERRQELVLVCLSVSSQGVGPGLDQEWGKGGSIKGSQIVLESKQRGCQQWNLQVGVPKWPEMAAP